MKSIKRFAILFFLLLLYRSANAQMNGFVYEVINGKDTSPVIGASVKYMIGSIGDITGPKGQFSLSKQAQTKIIVSFIGYKSDTIEVDTNSHFMKLYLKEGVVLKEATVYANEAFANIDVNAVYNSVTYNEGELRKAACCSLSESFESNASIDVAYADAATGTRQIQLLGLASPYTMLSIGNVAMMQGNLNTNAFSLIPGPWVKNIQLIKGSGSIVNGYNNPAGQINIDLFDSKKKQALQANVYVSEMLRNEYNLMYKFTPTTWMKSRTFGHYSNNPIKVDVNKDGFSDNPSGQKMAFAQVFNFSNKTFYEGETMLSFFKEDLQSANFGLNNTLTHKMPLMNGGPLHLIPYEINIHPQSINFVTKNGFILKREATSIGTQFSLSSNSLHLNYGDKSLTNDQNSLFYNVLFASYLGNQSHKYTVGLTGNVDNINETFVNSKYDRKVSNYGAYGEYTYNLDVRFTLVSALRYDLHSAYGSIFSPRLNLRYKPNCESNHVFRLSACRSTHGVNIFAENYGLMMSNRRWAIDSVANMPYGLKPEQVLNIGASWVKKFTLDYREGSLNTDVYYNQISNAVLMDLDQNTSQIHIYNSSKPSQVLAFQTELNYEIIKFVDVRIAYKYLYNQVYEKNFGYIQKALQSNHRGLFNIAYRTRKDWKFDATYVINGPKRIPYTNSNPTDFQLPANSTSYSLVNFQLSKQLKGFNVYAGAENIFNSVQKKSILDVGNPTSNYFDGSLVWGPTMGRVIYLGFYYKWEK